MNKPLYLIVFLLASALVNLAKAQAPAQYGGLIMDDEAYEKSPRLAVGGKAPITAAQYSLKQYTPFPGSQGECNSCVCWASCYGALTTSWAIKEKLTDKKAITNMGKSPMFVYIQIANSCSNGSKIGEALQVLKDQGTCSIYDFNPSIYNASNKPEVEPYRAVAFPYRIKDYAAVFPLDADSAKKIDETKLSIANNQPVVAGLQLYSSFLDLNKSNSFWQPNIATDKKMMAHAMMVVGYNDYQQTFEILNSWGYAWGNEGFFTISYHDYAALAKYGYQLTIDDRPAPNAPVRVNGDFVLQKFSSWDNEANSPLFENVTPKLVNNEYTLSGGDFNSGDYYRLFAKNISNNCYIYVFSIDPNNKAEVLYPFSKNAGFSAERKLGADVKEVPRQYSKSVIEIPGNNKVIKTDVAGVDQMCILYSYNPIDDISAVVDKVKASSQPELMDKLREVLGDRLMPDNTFRYKTESMSVSGLSNSGDVIPIILKVTVN